jgi:hypothetical protein
MNILSIINIAVFGISVLKYKTILSEPSTRFVFLLWYLLFLLLIIHDLKMNQSIQALKKSCCSDKKSDPSDDEDTPAPERKPKLIQQSQWPVYVIAILLASGILIGTYNMFVC